MADGIIVTVTAGATISENEQIVAEKLNALGSPTIALTGTLNTSGISDNAVTGGKIAVNTIVNSNIKSDAGIEFTKMESVADGYVIAGNGENSADKHELVGDVSISRAFSFDVIFAGATEQSATKVGDHVMVSTARGKIVKLGTPTGLTNTLHVLLVGSPPAELGINTPVYRQPDSLVVSHGSSVLPFGVGSVISSTNASALVTSVGSVTGSGPYSATTSISNITGVFSSGAALSVNGASVSGLSVGGSMSQIGATSPVGAQAAIDGKPLILATQVQQPAPAVKAQNITTGASDTSGKVLTSVGVNRSPQWVLPVVSAPFVRGGASPVMPTSFIAGNAYSGNTGHSSAWIIVGWEIASVNGSNRHLAHVYHPNAIYKNTAHSLTNGDIQDGEIVILADAAVAAGLPWEKYVPYQVNLVDTSTTFSGNATTTRRVYFTRLSDSVEALPLAGSSLSFTTKGWLCRQAVAMSGGRLFRSPWNKPDGTTLTDPSTSSSRTNSGGYCLVFSEPANGSDYAATITVGGIYDVAYSNGAVLGNASSEVAYSVCISSEMYRDANRIMFNTRACAVDGQYYEPRSINVIVYEQ